MKKFITIFVFILASVLSFAQGEADNWLFGRYCGMTFKTPDKSPKILLGSQMNADEGCASISDSKGNLLFYTDGTKVWNRDNVLMPNGDNLFGHISSTQSGVIVKKPASLNVYYIFTVDRQGGKHGLCYSIVDMTKANGRGDVVSKNNYLHYPVAEKITAVSHKSGKGIWIIAHEWNSNKYLSYLLTKDGVNSIPIVSAVGSDLSGDKMNASGYMKASPDGKYVAIAVYWDGIFEILRFDNQTGHLSNPITFHSEKYKYIYGVEFSSDVSKVYFSKSYEDAAIFQVDLKAGSVAEIINSITTIAQSSSYYMYQSLQIAPNKKIYVAKRNKHYLSAINEPNKNGAACNFVEYAFDLEDMVSNAGLPTFNQSFLDLFVEILGETEFCEGDSLILRTTEYNNAVYSWEGPQNISSDTSFLIIPNVSVNYSGYYKVTVEYGGLTKTDSVFVRVFPKPRASIMEGDTAYVCDGQSVVLTANPQVGSISYVWSTNEQTKSIEVSNPGLYYLIVTNENNCTDTAYIRVIKKYMDDVKILKTGGNKICEDELLILYTEKKYVSYDWSTGAHDSAISVTVPGIYWVDVVDEYGCRGRDSILVEKYDINFSRFQDFDFGKVIIGDEKSLDLKFTNYADDSLYVTSISKILSSKEFILEYNPSVPLWLKKNESINISIRFKPQSDGIFADSIGIIIAAPCQYNYAFKVFGYTEDEYSLVWMPDTTGKIGDTKFEIPLYGKLLTDDTLTLNITADISFDASIFIPEEKQPDIVENVINDGLRKLKIRIYNLEMTGNQRVLTNIKGTVLLNDSTCPLFVNNVEWSLEHVNTDISNGSLTAFGVCRPNISKIKLMQQNQIYIYPNPTSEYIRIKSSNLDFQIYGVSLFDYIGRLVKIFDKNSIEKIDEKTYKINVRDIGIGNYYLVIDSDYGRMNYQVIIYR